MTVYNKTKSKIFTQATRKESNCDTCTRKIKINDYYMYQQGFSSAKFCLKCVKKELKKFD